MKKILCLILAITMLTVVGFSATAIVVNPTTTENTATYDRGIWIPGDTIKFTDSGIITADKNSDNPIGYGDSIEVKALNSDNYVIKDIKYVDGKKLVESIKFNNKEDTVEIKLKQDFTNVREKDLIVTFILAGKRNGKNKATDIPIRVQGTVAYALDKTSVSIVDNDSVSIPSSFDKDTLYEVQKSDNASAGLMEFTAADNDTEISVRVYEDDRLYLYSEIDANTDVLKAYADTDADLEFLAFPGTPTFNSTATIRFYKDKDSYIYGIKNGKLINVNAKWSEDDGAFVLKARTLGAYVFSNKKLTVTTTATDNTVSNPDTGANDVVGIATALGIVSLISGVAVCLNRKE